MVRLTITPHRGNHARTFQHTGHLGLSPVSLAGVLQTSVEEDGALLDASSVQVRIRCYEAEWSNSCKALNFDKVRVAYEVSQTLWSSSSPASSNSAAPPPAAASTSKSNSNSIYKPLGNLKAPWRLSIPVSAIQDGALSSATYKRWRIWWALEAVVSHKPSGVHGSQLFRHFQLHLVSHAWPAPSRPLSWNSPSSGSASPDSAAPPIINYSAHLNSDNYSPGQNFLLQLGLQRTHVDPQMAIKKVTLELRREIIMTPMSNLSSPESDGGPPTPPDDLRLPENLDQKSEYFGSQPCSTANSPTAPDMLKSNSAFSPSGKTNAISVTSPGPSPGSARKEDILSIFSLSNSDVQFDPATGSCQLAFSGCIPRAKTMHHWSVGETCLTNGLSVRFYFAVCVHVKSRNAHANVIQLPPREITFYGVSAEDRNVAFQELEKAWRSQQDRIGSSSSRPGSAHTAKDSRRSLASDAPRSEVCRGGPSYSDSEDEEIRLRQARKRFPGASQSAASTPASSRPSSLTGPISLPSMAGSPGTGPTPSHKQQKPGASHVLQDAQKPHASFGTFNASPDGFAYPASPPSLDALEFSNSSWKTPETPMTSSSAVSSNTSSDVGIRRPTTAPMVLQPAPPANLYKKLRSRSRDRSSLQLHHQPYPPFNPTGASSSSTLPQDDSRNNNNNDNNAGSNGNTVRRGKCVRQLLGAVTEASSAPSNSNSTSAKSRPFAFLRRSSKPNMRTGEACTS